VNDQELLTAGHPAIIARHSTSYTVPVGDAVVIERISASGQFATVRTRNGGFTMVLVCDLKPVKRKDETKAESVVNAVPKPLGPPSPGGLYAHVYMERLQLIKDAGIKAMVVGDLSPFDSVKLPPNTQFEKYKLDMISAVSAALSKAPNRPTT
jgi:hypothetical protein